MSLGRDNHTNNVLVGAGEFYINLYDDRDNLTDERYLGDSVGGSLSVTTERVTVQSGDGPVARNLVDAVRSIERTLTLTLRDISHENLSLFVGAEAIEDVATRGAAVVDEAHTVKQGRFYQLGVSAEKPTGVGAVSEAGFAVAQAQGNRRFAPGADYRVDLKTGRLYIVPDAGIADGTELHVDYRPADNTNRRLVRTGDLRDVRAAIRYIETPTAGRPRHYYAPLCSIAPTGELALKSRDSEQQIGLTVSIIEPQGGAAALIIDGEVQQ